MYILSYCILSDMSPDFKARQSSSLHHIHNQGTLPRLINTYIAGQDTDILFIKF